MKSGLRLFFDILEVVIVLYVVFITSCILFKNRYGFTQFGDYTFIPVVNDNEKYIKDVKKGDLLIAKKVDKVSLSESIYFYTSENRNYIVREGKVTRVPMGDGDTLYDITVEMLDKSVDTTVSGSKIVGKKSTLLPLLGSVLTFLESRTGFLLCVLLPIVLVFLYQIYEFISVVRYERRLGKEEDKNTIEIVDIDKDSDDNTKPIQLVDEKDEDEEEEIEIL